jgi:lipopolysaccharide/colanic/teichoic acid biosynthesis glycosyltransferase
VPFIDITDKPIADWDHVKKWLFDKIGATLALILFAPVLAALAILIKLDSKGPRAVPPEAAGLQQRAD